MSKNISFKIVIQTFILCCSMLIGQSFYFKKYKDLEQQKTSLPFQQVQKLNFQSKPEYQDYFYEKHQNYSYYLSLDYQEKNQESYAQRQILNKQSNLKNFDDLIVANSSIQTKNLYKKLQEYYGKYIISGQTTKYYQDLKQIINSTPMIQGFDMQNYSPHNPWFGWNPVDDGTIDKAIQWYQSTNRKGIVSFQWHWFSPMGGQQRTSTFYTNYTNFNLSKAIITGTEQNIATIRDIDAIAFQLKRLQAQNIPILWRPLHEAGGGWFWWGSKTSKQTLKLLDILQDRIINYHKINNLIWIWSTPQSFWYPGHEKLDMIGFDSYPGSYNYTCQQFRFDSLRKLTQNRKMVQMSQNGPIPNFVDCLKQNITWGYFMSWADLVVQQNDVNHIKQTYASSLILTIQKLGFLDK